MKKVITIIICLLCALTAFAVSYATPYRGSAHSVCIHRTSSAHLHSIGGGGGGMASAPVATMGSVSSTRGIASNVACGTGASSVSIVTSAPSAFAGIYTSASSISGGMTTEETEHHHIHGRVRMGSGPDVPEDPDECPYCIDLIDNETGDPTPDGKCDRCGCDMDNCDCEGEHGYCWCPIELDWSAFMFLSVMALGYVFTKTRYNIFARAYNRLK